jgi:hypothetical protein
MTKTFPDSDLEEGGGRGGFITINDMEEDRGKFVV